MKKIIILILISFSFVSFGYSTKYKEENEEKVYKFIKSQAIDPEEIEEISKELIKSSKEFNIDPAIVASIIKQESNYYIYAKSSAGAMGLMQLMPGTAKDMGVEDPYDVAENIWGGIKYFKYCLRKTNNDLALALAAYNAGFGNVLKHNGIPPFKETQNYVNNILNTYNKKFGNDYKYNQVEFEKAVDGIFSEITFENAEAGEI
ncbi:lytic transglycosylase domain-containing protein [Fusobacterium periodonticum]|uniref:lytic transglycosylase domain-containing protein n=1 Tax=Fusobacterium periodonticum TaxID=860 RepID=UPI0028D4987A|nr:lytic transglycosylase domain-containing protein [Fusobacterium periodonticum]